MGRHSLVSELRYTNTYGARVWVPITTRCGSMKRVGMRLPRKSRDKTRTLHAHVLCVLCDLVNYCVFGVLDMFHVLRLLCVLGD